MLDINELKFDSNGLIPAIIQDAKSKKVLMMAYMNKESLKISMEKGLTCFYSRSRKELWLKGETSNNFQHIVSIEADCDKDTLLIKVVKDGPACHFNTDSCFDNNNNVYNSNTLQEFSYQGLYDLLKGRMDCPKEGSYTSYLFEQGLDKILKKVGEESTEVIIAAKDNDEYETVYEISDLVYHVMVLMVKQNIKLEDIFDELSKRHIIEHKEKQVKVSKPE